ncbi:hypothetical protein GS506_24640 [Rhodococcus hoagii]|nr:hypothetical protein [Prescottella equi]
MSKEENMALKVIESATKLPFVKVNREEFLVKVFKNTSVRPSELLDYGPQELFTKSELDKIARKVINANVLNHQVYLLLLGCLEDLQWQQLFPQMLHNFMVLF